MKKSNRKKKPIKILKKPTGSVRFSFISLKPKKSNQTQTEKNQAKPGKNRAKTKLNQAKPSQTEKPSQTSLNRFCPKKPNRNRSV